MFYEIFQEALLLFSHRAKAILLLVVTATAMEFLGMHTNDPGFAFLYSLGMMFAQALIPTLTFTDMTHSRPVSDIIRKTLSMSFGLLALKTLITLVAFPLGFLMFLAPYESESRFVLLLFSAKAVIVAYFLALYTGTPLLSMGKALVGVLKKNLLFPFICALMCGFLPFVMELTVNRAGFGTAAEALRILITNSALAICILALMTQIYVAEPDPETEHGENKPYGE